MNGEGARYDVFAIIFSIVLLGTLVPVLFYYFQKIDHDNLVLSEVSQLRSAVEINSIVTAHYPIEPTTVPLNDANSGTERLCFNSFTSYAESCDKVIIDKIQNSFPDEPYLYSTSVDGADYQIQFLLRKSRPAMGLLKGTQCATSQRMFSGTCPGF